MLLSFVTWKGINGVKQARLTDLEGSSYKASIKEQTMCALNLF